MCDIENNGHGDSFDVWRERMVRARKQHRCSSCDAIIAPGERYARLFWLSDGEHYSEVCCAACEDARRAFGEEHGWLTPPSCLDDLLEQCVDSGDEGSKRWQVTLDGIRARNAVAVKAKAVLLAKAGT